MWTLDSAAAIATLDIPGLSGTVDLGQPAAGFRLKSLQGHSVESFKSLLAIDLGQPGSGGSRGRPTEFFVRGCDLIATYPESDRQIRSQIYWRAIPATATSPEFGLEVMASLQTDLLDSDPRFVARTELAATTVEQLREGDPRQLQPLSFDSVAGVCELRPPPAALLFRSTDFPLAYLEIPFHGDAVATRLARQASPGGEKPRIRVEHDLLHEFLEKGVIRRCRLRGLFVPASGGDPLAREVVERFHQAELPLTA